MDKAGKLYVKAMNKYNDGYIDKALDLCEKSISLNSRNAASLNLKGILCYLKGDLEKAKNTWNINYKRNNDKVSKKYLNDSVRDKKNLQLFINSLELIKQYNISGALEILKQCQNSDFNFINVNNNISDCYIKQGEYTKALQYINEVLKVDKKNAKANINKNTLINYGNLKRDINYKKIFIITSTLSLIVIMVFFGTKFYKTQKISIMATEKIQNEKSLINKKDNEETTNLVKTENKVQEKPKFPEGQFKESIKNNNMEQIVLYLNKWKNADLEMNDKLLIVKGEEIIKKSGVLFFYEKGESYMSDKKFIEAQKYFLYALPYSSDNYLQEHIIYMLAVSYKDISDFQNAIKYYELNLKQFPSGSYTQEVLYNLILINKEVDINKAKEYAEKLVNQFPDSLYYNSIVKNILGK
ncbi:MAG TPA: tetratricopeptide repeat protein [Clostridium sp.]|uniref:tetratricopeptide repeat protein n=1 Tax=Clostridium sp. TaxID=1506 RepID=UPI002F942EED